MFVCIRRFFPWDPNNTWPGSWPADWAGFERIVSRYTHPAGTNRSCAQPGSPVQCATIAYFEPRNEPQTGNDPAGMTAAGIAFAQGEFKDFATHVRKAGGTSAKVTGPGAVCINPFMLYWYEGFFQGGGDKLIDAFSFHAYNAVNGDLALGRQSLDSLEVLLQKYGVQDKPRWQTEQGTIAPFYGSYHPRTQGRWIMIEKMLFEQYQIPKENDNLWYARSHGFWDVPAWWVNDDNSFNPTAALMRVWSEELHGKKFSARLDFGSQLETALIGSLFSGPQGSVVVIQSAGSIGVPVKVAVANANKTAMVVDAFGVESWVPIDGTGFATITVDELPVYIRGGTGVAKEDFGTNLARAAGVTITASGCNSTAVCASIMHRDWDNATFDCEAACQVEKLNNGEMETWYLNQNHNDTVWLSDKQTLSTTDVPGGWNASNSPYIDMSASFPATIDVALNSAQTVKRVPTPWPSALMFLVVESTHSLVVSLVDFLFLHMALFG